MRYHAQRLQHGRHWSNGVMKLGVMQPYFFPYIGYFHSIAAVDEFAICDQLEYSGESWMGRNRILGNTKDGWVYIRPRIEKPPGTKYLIEEINIAKDDLWRKKLIKTLKQTYSKAAHFDEVQPFIADLINHKPTTLSEFSCHAIQKIAELLQINTNISLNAPEFENLESELDDFLRFYRTQNPNINKRQARVLEFCRRKNATHFVNTIAGEHLYCRKMMREIGVHLQFVSSRTIVYPQVMNKDFVPNLSIIDVLMHNGVAGTIELLSAFDID